MPQRDVLDSRLRTAIAERRVVKFVLDGCKRIGEPHDYGIANGTRKLFFFQTAGESRSGRPFGWRWAELDKISELELLDRKFSGPRPTASGRHVHWDRVIASVSKSPDLD